MRYCLRIRKMEEKKGGDEVKRRLSVLLLLVLLLTGCGKQSGGRISRSGAGYQRMTEANGLCYLVELGGNVDTMD